MTLKIPNFRTSVLKLEITGFLWKKAKITKKNIAKLEFLCYYKEKVKGIVMDKKVITSEKGFYDPELCVRFMKVKAPKTSYVHGAKNSADYQMVLVERGNIEILCDHHGGDSLQQSVGGLFCLRRRGNCRE